MRSDAQQRPAAARTAIAWRSGIWIIGPWRARFVAVFLLVRRSWVLLIASSERRRQ